jgi:GWxTD domain-containing protein
MTTRPRHLLPVVTAVLVAAAAPGATESPAVDTRRFPKLAHVLLLPEERALLKELKDDKDRREFQKIFWARRDPTPGTSANEFEDNVRAVWKHADELFAYANQKGAETGCGQVLALLGRPEEVLGKGDVPRQPGVQVTGRGGRELPAGPGPGRPFDNMAYLREGSTREPETWVYRDRPGLPFHFTGAELRVLFDSECRFAEGGILAEDLHRAAAALVTRPDLAYDRGSDGHLVPLSARRGAAAGALDLVTSPRSDFALAAETKLVMRAPKGEALVAGLARFPPPAAGGTPPSGVSLAVRAADATGNTVMTAARDSLVAPAADGSSVASWSLSLKPGRYQVTVAGLVPETSLGSTSTLDVEVPDFGGKALAASPLVLYPDEPPAAGGTNARDPYAAMLLGPQRLRPRFGNVFAPADALMVVATLYGGRVDPGTGQAGLRARFSILKDGKPVARGAEDAFTTPDAVASVGPIPLSTYAPGAYVVRLDVTDAAASQTLRQEVPFEIRKP